MPRPVLLLLAILAAQPRAVHAQVALVQRNGKTEQVIRDVDAEHLGLIESGSKWTQAKKDGLTLAPAVSFRRGLVELSEFQVTEATRDTTHSLSTPSNLPVNLTITISSSSLTVSARLKSDAPLTHCFLVLDLGLLDPRVQKLRLNLIKVPDLTPGAIVAIKEELIFPVLLENLQMQVHFFSQGDEILHTMLDRGYITDQIRKTEVLAAGAAEYPAIVRKTVAPKLPKTYRPMSPPVVSTEIKVDAKGGVVSAKPAPGLDAAVAKALTAAVKQWQFDPAIKQGRPAESTFVLAVPLPEPVSR